MKIMTRAAAFATICLSLWTVEPARADMPCATPDDLALRHISLPIARLAIEHDKTLVVLTLGGAHTAGEDMDSRSATYPALLETSLAAALSPAIVTVVNGAVSNATALDIPPKLPGLIEKTGARLVIWAPGGRDVALRLDPEEFRAAVAAGIAAARRAGADLILLDTTFVPSPTRMALIGPYRDRLRQAAADSRIPFLARHDMMLRWSKDGTLNLQAREPAEQVQVARQLFACVAQSLAVPIAAALR